MLASVQALEPLRQRSLPADDLGFLEIVTEAADLLGAARPLVVRYYLGSAHYRSTID